MPLKTWRGLLAPGCVFRACAKPLGRSKTDYESGESDRWGPARKEGIINRRKNLCRQPYRGDHQDWPERYGQFAGRHIHLTAGKQRHGALVLRRAAIGMQQTVQCPDLSHREDKQEQAQKQSRLRPKARRDVSCWLLNPVHHHKLS